MQGYSSEVLMHDESLHRPGRGNPRTPLRWAGAAFAAVLLAAGGAAPAVDHDAADQARSGKPVLVLDPGGHRVPARAVLFTPDGKRVITASLDKTVRVWDAGTGACLRVLRLPSHPGAEGEFHAAALAPDGKTLAVAGLGHHDGGRRSSPVYLIDVEAGGILDGGVLRAHESPVEALAFSPDGKLLASAGDAKQIRVWDVQKRTCLHVLLGHQAPVKALAFSPDGTRLASGGDDKLVFLWSPATGKEEFHFRNGDGKAGPWSHVSCLAWSPDGRTLATPGQWQKEAAVRLWNAADGRHLGNLAGDVGAVGKWQGKVWLNFLRFTPDSTGLVVTASDGWPLTAKVYDVPTGELRSKIQADWIQAPFAAGGLSPDGTVAAVAASPASAVYLWRVQDGKLLGRLVGKGMPIYGTGWLGGGNAIAWRITPMPKVEPPFPFERSFHLTDLKLGPARTKDCRRERHREGGLALHRSQGWNTVTVKHDETVVATLDFKNNSAQHLTFVGKDRVAVAGNGRFLGLFDAATGKRLLSYRGFLGNVKHLAPSPDGRYLLAGGEDETLHVFGRDRPEPLLSLFVVGGEWVAWTPAGYYAASLGGERLMGWQVDNGPDALGTFYPAKQFHASLYRPDVIRRVLEEGSVAKALTAADQVKGQARSEAVEVAEVLPPKVALRAPTVHGGQVTRSTVQVEASARAVGKHPIRALLLVLDGRPYPGGTALYPVPAEAGAEVRHTWTVELTPGEHTLRVLARSAASTGLSNDLEITFGTPVAKPRLFLLSVGIDAYADKNLTLHCAANDARGLADTFVKKGAALFDVKPKVLTNDEAKREKILEGLDWLKDNVKKEDVTVVFFAGHGDTEGTRFYLLPQDVRVKDLENTAISGEELKQKLADLPGRVVLLLDACHSGAVGKAILDLARDLADEDCGVVVMCAALGSEMAGEADGHGFFCRALMEVLGGERQAPRNPRDGCVYLHHVEQWVIDRVQELSKDEQHPTAARPALRPLALAKP
jgi:WD40 repeat protein